jgi:pimeloyl-ACP methyl ester carboxylesterase
MLFSYLLAFIFLAIRLDVSPVTAFSTPAFTLSRKSTQFSLRRYQSTTDSSTETSTAAATTEEPEETKRTPLVQRYYETYQWKGRYNINYRVEGPETGRKILLIHGFGGNVNHYRFQFPALAEAGYRVYGIDLLGFGGSDKASDADYSIELFVELCIDFIKGINGNDDTSHKWIVCGNSIGGLITLGVAASIPELTRACVLFNCAGGMTTFRYEDVSPALRPVLWLIQNVVLGPQFGGRFFANFKTRENVEAILKQQGVYCDTTNVDEYLLELLLGPSDDEGAEQVFLKVFGGPPGPTPESLLPNVEAPILALWGEADPWTPVDRGMHPGINFPQYAAGPFTLDILPGVGHCPHDENPDAIHERMLPWLAKLE